MEDMFQRARINKDPNFDGRFFFGVKTTGIFCRPSCPSPIAEEGNVLYFKTVFEALDHGFRPCYRCRPDVSTEYSTGNGDAEFVINAALQMIYEGYLNDHSLRDLAQQLLISDRHLRKLFIDHLGVPPVRIAQYHRALFAKKLLVASRHSVSDVAYASGFGSIRQFNDVCRSVFGKSPTMIRRQGESLNTTSGNTTLLVKYRKPFSFGQLLAFLRPRAMTGVEVVTEQSYSRTFRMGMAKGFFTVSDAPELSALQLQIRCDDVTCYMAVNNRVRKLFDLDTDFTDINRKCAGDPLLSLGMENGCVPRLSLAFDPFECVVRAVLGQQVSVKAATTLAARLAETAALACEENSVAGLKFYFPDSTEILSLDLTGSGITTTRQTTLRTICRAIVDKSVSLRAHQPYDHFRKEFKTLKGVGDWTVSYVAMRGFGDFDRFPATDLGVIRAITAAGEVSSPKEIRAYAEKWRPYRSYATLCLWNYIQKKDET